MTHFIPDDNMKETFQKFCIIKCYQYLILPDTDSASLQLVFIYKVGFITENQARKSIFDNLLDSKKVFGISLVHKINL